VTDQFCDPKRIPDVLKRIADEIATGGGTFSAAVRNELSNNRCNGPELALLAPAAERARSAHRRRIGA
jgi:hypothetical protein